jgi:VanZ family protein
MEQTKKNSPTRWTWGALWVAYALLIFYFSSQSLPEDSPVFKIPFWDAWSHLAEYFLFGWLTLKTLQPQARREGMMALVIALAYAASDEVHQIFVATRSASFSDWSADAVGILLSTWVYAWRRKSRTAEIQ